EHVLFEPEQDVVDRVTRAIQHLADQLERLRTRLARPVDDVRNQGAGALERLYYLFQYSLGFRPRPLERITHGPANPLEGSHDFAPGERRSGLRLLQHPVEQLAHRAQATEQRMERATKDREALLHRRAEHVRDRLARLDRRLEQPARKIP